MTTTTPEAVRWGIVSTANIATKVGQAIQRAAGACLLAIASRTEERAQRWANEHQVERAYGSYEALLRDPEVEAVYLPLPPSMHAEWTIKAAEHGKHVLCEKPLALTADEAIAMATACQRHQVQLMDGVMWVHHERTEAMRQLLNEGALGRLRRVTAAFTFNWDRVPTDNIRVKPELGGGSLGDLGYYCIRAILWAFDDLPVRVYATARYAHGVDFNLSALLWFEDERIASFDCGFDTSLRQWLEIAGTGGTLVCGDFVLPSDRDGARFWLRGTRDGQGEHQVGGAPQEVRMIERFSRIVRSRHLEARWPSEAIATVQVCQAVRESAQRGESVVLTQPGST